ncbi:tetratricopeptide repeat protein [Roseibium sp.]|uniref:tetratricopeptide repeat protein n=1 Tax=Roseibium sp. TaxID=1936156 RepID=UPI003BA882E3
MSYLNNFLKIIGLIVSAVLIIEPSIVKSREDLLVYHFVFEFKFIIVSLVLALVFADKIFLLVKWFLEKFPKFIFSIQVLFRRKKYGDYVFVVISCFLFAAASGVMISGLAQIFFVEVRSASYLYAGNNEIVRQKIVFRINENLQEGRLREAIHKIDELVKLFPNDYRVRYSRKLADELQVITEISEHLTEKGMAHRSKGQLRSAAKNLQFAYLLNPGNNLANDEYSRILDTLDRPEFSEMIETLIAECNGTIAEFLVAGERQRTEPVIQVYTDTSELKRAMLHKILCERGIFEDPYAVSLQDPGPPVDQWGYVIEDRTDPASLPPRKIVKGLKYYSDVEEVRADLRLSMDYRGQHD